MGTIKLLDCTLRDGGYVNDWEFGYDNIVNIFERLVASKVDIIEIGFLDAKRSFDINRTIMPDTQSVQKIYGNLNKENTMIVGMIDYGTCSIEHIQLCEESYLDGIRVIFKEHFMYKAVDFCHQLKEKGYKVFAQMVSVTTYSDEKLKEFAELVNDVGLYGVGIVDTYGLLHQKDLMHIFEILNQYLDNDIAIGYHSHNNFQLAYANCIEVLNTGVKRDILVDGSLYGMGKSAGNAPIELVAMYMNEHLGKKYEVSQMLEAIDNNIMDIYHKIQWGYNLLYYVSAASKCHPNYVSFLMNKRTLSIKSVTDILGNLKETEKLLYDQKIIEKLYLEYQDRECQDTEAFQELGKKWSDKNILVIGPGLSVNTEYQKIQKYIENHQPIVIAINYLPQTIATDYVFLSNSKRYGHLVTKLIQNDIREIKLIATSNITGTSEKQFDYIMAYNKLIDPEAIIPDNSFIMFLRALIRMQKRMVAVAGFDGYSESENNYCHTDMEYDFIKEKAHYLNECTRNFLKVHLRDIQVNFITPSRYLEENV